MRWSARHGNPAKSKLNGVLVYLRRPLLANACESLASASVMLSDFAGLMDGPYRNTMQGIQQVVMLGELAVNRVLDNLNPPA